MKRKRGDLYRDVLAVMPEGVALSTPQVADAIPAPRPLVGVCLCRATKKGLVVRADAQPGTQTGTRAATWMRTAKPYEVGKGGGRPQPERPHSRYRPKPANQQPRVKPPGLKDCAHRTPVSPCVVTGPETVAEWMLRTGNRPEVLRGFEAASPVRIPVRQRVAGHRAA